jgi:integrase/recombinase XerD
MIISEAYGQFLIYCRAERHVSDSSLTKYRDCFSSWLEPWFGQKEVSSINRLHVLDMRQAMMNRQLSVARQYSVIMTLKSFLKFCRSSLGLAGIDPSEITLPKRKAPQVEFLGNDEIQRILNAIDTGSFTGIRLRALVELLLSTGMRISEALSLKRDMFDTDQNEAEIVGKGKLKRHVFFSPRCRFWLKQYLAKRYDDSPWLFVTTGYPVRKWAQADISRFFILLKKRAGITKKLTPHILRHTFCTNLLHHGADITHIKDLAGHQDIQTTARYYLGKDKAVLRQIVDRCLDYRSGSPGLPHALESAFGPKASLHREEANQGTMLDGPINPSQPSAVSAL